MSLTTQRPTKETEATVLFPAARVQPLKFSRSLGYFTGRKQRELGSSLLVSCRSSGAFGAVAPSVRTTDIDRGTFQIFVALVQRESEAE